jgi:hypothetical protein
MYYSKKIISNANKESRFLTKLRQLVFYVLSSFAALAFATGCGDIMTDPGETTSQVNQSKDNFVTFGSNVFGKVTSPYQLELEFS